MPLSEPRMATSTIAATCAAHLSGERLHSAATARAASAAPSWTPPSSHSASRMSAARSDETPTSASNRRSSESLASAAAALRGTMCSTPALDQRRLSSRRTSAAPSADIALR